MYGLVPIVAAVGIGALVLWTRWRTDKSRVVVLAGGLWFGLLGIAVFSWGVFFVAYNDFVYDPPCYSEIFGYLIPVWYDRLLEWTLPNALLAIAASSSVLRTWSGALLRCALFGLIWSAWGRMAFSVPWEVLHSRGLTGSSLPVPHVPKLNVDDMSPLLNQSLDAVIAIAVICGLAAILELRMRTRGDTGARDWLGA